MDTCKLKNVIINRFKNNGRFQSYLSLVILRDFLLLPRLSLLFTIVNKLSRFFLLTKHYVISQSNSFPRCAELKRIFLIFSEIRQSSKKNFFLVCDQKIKCYFLMSYLARLHPPFNKFFRCDCLYHKSSFAYKKMIPKKNAWARIDEVWIKRELFGTQTGY